MNCTSSLKILIAYVRYLGRPFTSICQYISMELSGLACTLLEPLICKHLGGIYRLNLMSSFTEEIHCINYYVITTNKAYNTILKNFTINKAQRDKAYIVDTKSITIQNTKASNQIDDCLLR